MTVSPCIVKGNVGKGFQWDDFRAKDKEMTKDDPEEPIVATNVLIKSESIVIGSTGSERCRGGVTSGSRGSGRGREKERNRHRERQRKVKRRLELNKVINQKTQMSSNSKASDRFHFRAC